MLVLSSFTLGRNQRSLVLDTIFAKTARGTKSVAAESHALWLRRSSETAVAELTACRSEFEAVLERN